MHEKGSYPALLPEEDWYRKEALSIPKDASSAKLSVKLPLAMSDRCEPSRAGLLIFVERTKKAPLRGPCLDFHFGVAAYLASRVDRLVTGGEALISVDRRLV